MKEEHLHSTEQLVSEQSLIRMARIVSAVFTPVTIPFLAFGILFLFSYLRLLPYQYKLIVMGVVFCFTILMPLFTIHTYKRINGLSRDEMAERKHRYASLILTLIGYIFCLIMMHRMNLPYYMNGIIICALLMILVCTVCNLKWRVSEHMAGAGAIIGGLVAFSTLLSYNPLWWLTLFILIAGTLGTARIILGHHTLGEVIGGFVVGLLCSLLVLHPLSNFFLFKFIIQLIAP